MVPGARHIIAQQSEHNIHVDQPVLVNRSNPPGGRRRSPGRQKAWRLTGHARW
jgi:hypothetical protein